MASGKRASMREGPLAALFRKTSEDGLQEEAPPEAVAQNKPKAADKAPEPVAEQQEIPLEESQPASNIPSPKDRIKNVFSSDVPEDILDGAAARRRGTQDNWESSDIYERSGSISAGQPLIRVVGVGGAGVNAVNRMIEVGITGVEFIAVNTDAQSLQQSDADVKVHVGETITRGLGAGSNPEVGRQAAVEDYDRLKSLLKGSDMVFIAAGAGGGTGTGAAPVVARVARETGALAVGIITRPFQFEGSRRRGQADEGILAFAEEVDTLIVVPNDRLLTVLDKNTSMVEAFRVADDVLRQGVQGISDLVTLPGLINLDFADVRTIMTDAGAALLGIGMGSGENRALDAAEAAVSSPLLETSMEGARSILLSITGGSDLSLWEVNEAAKTVADAAHPDANIIFGAMVDENLADDQVWITVVATRYRESAPKRESRAVLKEPAGEVRVRRAERPREREKLEVNELNVPEFIPKGS